MSAFTGKQHKGAMRARREKKKRDAEIRNALTRPERRAEHKPHPYPASAS